MRYCLPVTLLASALLLGCAGPSPFTMTCSALQISAVTQAGQQVEMGDFTIEGPRGDGWCLGPRDSQGVVFYSHPLMGQYIERPERSMARSSVVMAAFKIRHEEAEVKTAGELQQLVDAWIKRGFGTKGGGSELIVGDNTVERATLVRSNVRPEPTSDAVCVSYDYVMEERDNPNPIAADIVLILTDHGVICRHPNASDYLVVMSLSERYERGNQIDPSLFQMLKSQEAGHFFDSLQFAPTG